MNLDVSESHRAVLYEQDMEQWRFLDHQKWSRFQTASAIEGALIYSVFGDGIFDRFEKTIAISLATLILILIFSIVIIENKDQESYLERIRKFENCNGHVFVRKRIPFVGTFSSYVLMFLLISANMFLISYVNR